MNKKIIGTILIALLVIVFTGSYFLFGRPTPKHEPSTTLTPTPLPSVTASTIYGGTTLVCSGNLSLGNDGGNPILIVNANITNIGNVAAYNVSLRIQTYYPNDTEVIDCVKKLDATNIYGLSIGYPVDLFPGQSYSIGLRGTETFLSKGCFYNGTVPVNLADNAILTDYTLTPTWVSTPPTG